ncbi:MAG: hypothetical protein N2053_09905 [Chitinispirillaceae bacterium]|nr:hypothetical protein [Chitinispirillaceae bacterium]
MRIGLTYDLRSEYLKMGYGEEETAEFDRDDTIDSIENALRELGYETVRIGHIRSLVNRLVKGERWDLVFNISEGMYGVSREAQVPALLEAYNIPFTGSDALTLALSHHKGYTKQIVEKAGIKTPSFFIVKSLEDISTKNLSFPLFVKPIAEGTGKGITSNSKVDDIESLKKQCLYIIERYKQPALVESYLSGREVTVGIVGSGRRAKVVGVLEIESIKGAEPNAYTYFNKENCEEVVKYSLVKEKEIIEKVTSPSLYAWEALDGKDFGRMDFRADDKGNFYFLEVNALPGLHPKHSDLPMIWEFSGYKYVDLIKEIVNSARSRYGI